MFVYTVFFVNKTQQKPEKVIQLQSTECHFVQIAMEGGVLVAR